MQQTSIHAKKHMNNNKKLGLQTVLSKFKKNVNRIILNKLNLKMTLTNHN